MIFQMSLCKCDNFVIIVFPVLSSEAHFTSSAAYSAENNKELTPDGQETSPASGNRLQYLPEWYTGIYGKSGGTKVHVLWK